MTSDDILGKTQGKHLANASRVAGNPELLVYDKGGYLGLWYLSIEPHNPGRELKPPRPISLEKGELPIEAFNRTLARAEIHGTALMAQMIAKECGLDRPIWSKGSEAGLVAEIRLILGHLYRAHGIAIRTGEVMMFCNTGIFNNEARLHLAIGDIIGRGDCKTICRDFRGELVADLQRLWPAMLTRNYPVGCSYHGGGYHSHQPLRFTMLIDMRETTSHQAMEDEALYQVLNA